MSSSFDIQTLANNAQNIASITANAQNLASTAKQDYAKLDPNQQEAANLFATGAALEVVGHALADVANSPQLGNLIENAIRKEPVQEQAPLEMTAAEYLSMIEMQGAMAESMGSHLIGEARMLMGN